MRDDDANLVDAHVLIASLKAPLLPWCAAVLV